MLDAIDRRILTEMQRDASRSTAEIAEAVGVSQAACWRRVQRLKTEGYIERQVAVLDRRKLGLKTQIFAQLKLSPTARPSAETFDEAVRALPEVLECYLVLGGADYLLRVVTTDLETYERFLFDKLLKLPGVIDVNSTVALSEVKSFSGVQVGG